MMPRERVLGLKLLVNHFTSAGEKKNELSREMDDILDSISSILHNNSTETFTYQDLYNKVYSICVSDLRDVLYDRIDTELTVFFENLTFKLVSLEEFIADFDSLNEKLTKINSLFIYLNRKLDGNKQNVYLLALSKFKNIVLLNEEISEFLEVQVLKAISEERYLFHCDYITKSLTSVNRLLLLLEEQGIMASNGLEQKIISVFRECFAAHIERNYKGDYNLYNYIRYVSKTFKKDQMFISSISAIDSDLETKIYEQFIGVFITEMAPRLISEEMFVSPADDSAALMINNKYIIDYIYTEETKRLINRIYQSFLFQNLKSQVFQLDTANITNKKEYICLVEQLTTILVNLYCDNLKFLESEVVSVGHIVNSELQLVLQDFLKMILNDDSKFELGIEHNKWFVILIRYIDNLLNVTDASGVDLAVVTNVIKILDLLEEERFEIFLNMYENLMGKRLMSENIAVLHLEHNIIKIMESNLNHQNGRNKEEITRMGHMVNDFILAKNLNRKFVEENKDSHEESDVKVLNQFFWSSLVDDENSFFKNLIIPEPLKETVLKFEGFYRKSYDARNIKWLYQHWQIDFEHFLNGKTYLFVAPLITSIVFYHISSNDFVTIKLLKKLTGLPTKQIVQNLATLSIKYGVISHYDKDAKLSEEKSSIKDGDIFTLNKHYSNAKDVIKINLMSITKK